MSAGSHKKSEARSGRGGEGRGARDDKVDGSRDSWGHCKSNVGKDAEPDGFEKGVDGAFRDSIEVQHAFCCGRRRDSKRENEE